MTATSTKTRARLACAALAATALLAGCNAGACHAKPEGQNGFKLSVFPIKWVNTTASPVRAVAILED